MNELAKAEAAREKLRIMVRGTNRKYYLVPPAPQRNRPDFYVRFEVPRDVRERDPALPKTVLRSTGTNILLAAKARGREIIEGVLEGRWAAVEKLKLRVDSATVGEVLERYDPAGPNAEVKRRNIAQARMFAREVTGREKVDELPVQAVFNGATGRSFKANRLAVVQGADYLQQARVGRTVNSTLTQVKSIFSKEALAECYGDLRLPKEAIAEFKATSRVKLHDEEVGFEPWPAGFSERVEAEAQALASTNRNLYLTYLLMSRLGLRNKEVEMAKWDALEVMDGRTQFVVRLRSYSRSKNGRSRALILSPELLAKLAPFRGSREEWIIDTATNTERHNVTHREINRWLRPLMVAAGMKAGEAAGDRAKCAYQLRGHAGSRVLTLTGSIAAAAAFLGDSEETARKHYARWLKPVEALSTHDFVQTFSVVAA